MAEEELSQISVGEFETVTQLLASSESLQLAFFNVYVRTCSKNTKMFIYVRAITQSFCITYATY